MKKKLFQISNYRLMYLLLLDIDLGRCIHDTMLNWFFFSDQSRSVLFGGGWMRKITFTVILLFIDWSIYESIIFPMVYRTYLIILNLNMYKFTYVIFLILTLNRIFATVKINWNSLFCHFNLSNLSNNVLTHFIILN